MHHGDLHGNVPTADTGVRLYGKVTGDNLLAAALQVTVQVSTPGLTPTPGADCTGFAAAPGSATSSFTAFPADYAAGLRDLNNDNAPDWRPSPKTPGDLSRTYKISYSLPAVAYGVEYQGKAVQMAFTWEVQSDDTPGT